MQVAFNHCPNLFDASDASASSTYCTRFCMGIGAMFNKERYWERVQAGELVAVPIHTGTPSPESGQPPGTTTKTFAIRETANGPDLAHAHAFIRPDGTIGASGKPDPKRIWKDGKLS